MNVIFVHDAGMPDVISVASEFRGLWTRSLLTWPDGRCDIQTQVIWLQSVSLFADLRQPPGLSARLSAASCRNALTAQDCLALSAQQGFAGVFEPRFGVHGAGAHEWVRRIDYQPPQATRDIGRLFWRGEILVEEGVESAYTEHWHRESQILERACAGLWLHDPARGIDGCLLRGGDWFAYARGRDVGLGVMAFADASLAELVAGAGSLQQMQALVDCEISLGRVQDWWIARSSLPYKVRVALDAQIKPGVLAVADRDEAGREMERIWEITAEEGDISALLDTIPKRPLNGRGVSADEQKPLSVRTEAGR